MNKCAKDLLDLVRENPDLPIIPFVNYEVCAGDECAYWLGSFDLCRVDEYAIVEVHGEDRTYLKDDEEEIRDYYYDCTYGMDDEEADAEVQRQMDRIEWTKAIIVFIDLPDV